MKVFNTRVYGFEESLVRSGYPMLTDIDEMVYDFDDFLDGWSGHPDNGIKRSMKLGSTPIGSGHDNFLNGIIVQMDVEAPSYWWPQLQRYHFVEFVSSQSKMHRLVQMVKADKKPEGVNRELWLAYLYVYEKYLDGDITFDDLLANTPMGLELTAGLSTNYRQLKTIYAQRKDHKLKMWREIFCPWIVSLPKVKELGVIK